MDTTDMTKETENTADTANTVDAAHTGAPVKVFRNYKDSLFRMIFREKDALLSLYNAVNGTAYDDPDALEIVTLENAIYFKTRLRVLARNSGQLADIFLSEFLRILAERLSRSEYNLRPR